MEGWGVSALGAIDGADWLESTPLMIAQPPSGEPTELIGCGSWPAQPLADHGELQRCGDLGGGSHR